MTSSWSLILQQRNVLHQDVTKPIAVFSPILRTRLKMLTEFTTLPKYRLPIQCVIHRLQWLPFCLRQVEINYMLTLRWSRKSRKLIDAPPPPPEGGIQAMEKKQANQRCESWKYVCALYLGWTVALLLTIERRATARQVNKPIQDMGTLTAQRTMGSGYTRGRLPYFELRYSWRLQASGM